MDRDGYFIKVNVSGITRDVKTRLPSQVGDIRVLVEFVDEIYPDDLQE